MRPPLSGIGPRERFLAVFGSLFPEPEWPEAKLAGLLDVLRFRELKEGEVLLREGQSCASVPFVVEGSIRVFKSAESGREITLYRIERGQSCILSSGCGSSLESFPASAVVEAPSFAAFFPTDTVRALLAKSEQFRNFVLDQYSRRMVETMELVQEVAFRRVDERLAQWLSERASAGKASAGGGSGGAQAPVTATHQELADHIGTSREVVSRILKDWEQRSLVELSRGSIALLPAFATLRVRDRSE
jgi:CRP/FNR family transcriptional regulator, anaerobic regulatory protein